MEHTIKTDQKLAAIMFTDIISYTKMMGKNEKKTLALLKEHNLLLNEQFTKHSGNVIKETGDGFLTSFSSPLKSVTAAIAIQNSLHLYNSTQDTDDQINIRIGIHLSEIVNKDENGSVDLLGNGVNIASRIEGFSEPNGGGLCFSQQIYDHVHDKIKNYPIESIGKKRLKGITKPYELYRLILPFQKSDVRSVGERKVKNSIAVLAFDNMSPDKDNEYFADGITESLLDVMAKEKELKVISRTSAFSYKSKNIPAKQIGRELNVEHILEGSVRKAGDKVRITAQLIQVADDFHLWSETYDRTLEDIFAIQDEIASKILTELLDRIIACECCGQTNNQEAYDLYQKGRHHWNLRSKEELEKAINCFENCLNVDPNFSKAYSGLIDSWIMQIRRQHEHKKDILPKCKEAIENAESLGDVSAEIYTSKSEIFKIEGDNNKSLEYLKTAIDENPNYATAHHWLSLLYGEMGEHEKSLEEIEKAVALDPKSPIILFATCMRYRIAGNRNKQKEYLQKTMDLAPGFQSIEVQLGRLLMEEYKWEDAEKHLLNLRKLHFYKNSSENQRNLSITLIQLYMICNKNDKAENILSEMMKIIENNKNTINTHSYCCVADWHYLLGNNILSSQYYTMALDHGLFSEPKAYHHCFKSLPLIFEKKYEEALESLNNAVKSANKLDDEVHRTNVLLWIEYARTLYFIESNDIENTYLNINKIKNMHTGADEYHSHEKEKILYFLYMANSDFDKGFKWYDKFIQLRKRPCYEIIIDPSCRYARKDKRFVELLKKMELYDYWKDSL